MDNFSEVLGLRGMEKVVSKREFVVDALFYSKPVQRFKYRGDMFSFRGSSYYGSKEVLQLLEMRYLFLR